MPKAFDSSDSVTGQLAAPDHAIDSHRRELQQISELPDSIELLLGVVLRTRSWHFSPYSFRGPPVVEYFANPRLRCAILWGIRRPCQACSLTSMHILLTQWLGASICYLLIHDQLYTPNARLLHLRVGFCQND